MEGWMSSGYNRNYSPYGLQRYQITKVNGRAGAENFRMAPDSNFLLLDNNDPILWVVQTDGGGLLTATPWDISPHQEPKAVDLNALQERILALEERLNESNFGTTKQQRKANANKQQQPITETTT